MCITCAFMCTCAFTCIYSFLRLSVCLPAHSDFCLCWSILAFQFHLDLSVYKCIHTSLHFSKLFVNIVIESLSNDWYINEAICLSMYTLSTSMHSSICLSVRTSIYHLSMIDRSIHLSIYPCVYLSIYLPGFCLCCVWVFSINTWSKGGKRSSACCS